MRGIAIPFEEEEFKVRDLKLLEAKSAYVTLDGDKREIVVINPKPDLIEELENRGIKFRELKKDELKRYLVDIISS